MIGYGIRVIGGLVAVTVGALLLVDAAYRILPSDQAIAGTSATLDRTNKGDRASRAAAVVQEQKRITTVEVVGVRDAAIIYRGRDGHVLFSTDPLANVTVVVKNIALPEVTVRETSQSEVNVLPLERPAAPKAQLSEGCESAVSAVTTPTLAGVASRCLAATKAGAAFASLR
jgi:hypothetical protein